MHTARPWGFPETLLSDTRMGVKAPGCCETTQGRFLWLGAIWGLGYCGIQMMERGSAPAKGPVGAWGDPSQPAQTPQLLWKCKQRGKDVSKSCSVNLISARLKDSWSEETCLL